MFTVLDVIVYELFIVTCALSWMLAEVDELFIVVSITNLYFCPLYAILFKYVWLKV